MSIHRETTGRSLHEPAQYHVENATGVTIPKGTVVKRAGWGTYLRVTPVTSTSDEAFGVVVDQILDGTSGYAARGGIFGQFNTSGWAAETLLYKDSSGNLTDTVAGDAVCRVLISDALNGKFFITLDDGPQGPQGPAGPSGSIDKWASGNSYITDEVVWLQADYKFYVCTTSNSDVSFIPSNWAEISAGNIAPVDTVFGRTGTVTAQTNDYTWAQINKATSSLSDITTRPHSSLTGVGSKTHSQIDTHIGDGTQHFRRWSSGGPYIVGDVVWLAADDKIYRCITPNTDVSFVGGNWIALSVESAAAAIFEKSGDSISNSGGDYAVDDFTVGGSGPDDVGNSSKMSFDKSFGSFMVGRNLNVAARGGDIAVFGRDHTSSAHFTLQAGSGNNTVSGANASVNLGTYNTARGAACAVLGGAYNEAKKAYGVVMGKSGTNNGAGSVLASLTNNVAETNNINVLSEDRVFAVMGGPIKLPEFTIATLPPVTVGGMIYVSDETGGPVVAFSDGVNWMRISDKVVVS